MNERHGPVASAYLDVVASEIEADLGAPLGSGTTIVPAADRAGSRVAVHYDVDGRTAIWCDPDLADLLAPLAGPAITVDEFFTRCDTLGGAPAGVGENRVLEEGTESAALATIVPPLHDRYVPMWLRPDDADDLALLAGLRSALSDDDADEAEFDLDDLDPVIAGLVVEADGRRSLVAQVGSRPWRPGTPLADIAVAVHPAHRRRGLGAALVGHFAHERSVFAEQLLYRYDIDNTASKTLADTVGFTIVHRVAAAHFGDDSGDTE